MGNNFGPWSGTGKNKFHLVQPASAFGNNAKSLSVWGWDEIIKNLNFIIIEKGLASKKGLLEVAKYIRRDMAENQPFIPKDIGNLDASWETHQITEGKKYGLLMGFSANYALWVHEMIDPGIKWSKEGSGPKFFEKSLNRNHDTILQILADNMKVK